jgi:sec-independent protein translocase protein TatA
LFTSILQPSHLVIILVSALLILAPKRLPDAGRALGQALKEFKGSVSDAHDDASAQEVSASVSADHEHALLWRPAGLTVERRCRGGFLPVLPARSA